MFRRAGVLLVAALLPVAAGAETVAVAEPQAAVRGIAKEDLARCRQEWTDALGRAGLTTVPARGKGKAGPAAEFVASLAIDRDGEAVVFTGLATRVRLDRWGFRHEARAAYADPASWPAVLDLLAQNLAGAVHASPPRNTAQPPPRARVKLKHLAVAPPDASAPASTAAAAPAEPVSAAAEAPAPVETEDEATADAE